MDQTLYSKGLDKVHGNQTIKFIGELNVNQVTGEADCLFNAIQC